MTSQPDWELIRRFSDQASGATTERPELKRALAEARAGRFDLLLVYRVDRFSRSMRGLTQLLEDLDSAGVALRSATEPFDTATPAGRMMVQMLAVFAEFERATIIDWVIAGMERKAACGEWCAGAKRPQCLHGLVGDLGAPEASPFNAALAAASASVGLDLPRRRRTWWFGRITSTTVTPSAPRCRASPAP